MKRQIIRNVDTEQKIYGMIPLKRFLLFVLPISGVFFAINFIGLIRSKISLPFLMFSIFVIAINLFMASDLKFGQSGFDMIYDLIFHSKITHIENFRKQK